jgi:hypothetical protein
LPFPATPEIAPLDAESLLDGRFDGGEEMDISQGIDRQHERPVIPV